MAEENDLIWVQDAVKEFSRSQVWLYDQMKKGTLTRYVIPGDGKTYLSREELRNLLKPRPATPKRDEP